MKKSIIMICLAMSYMGGFAQESFPYTITDETPNQDNLSLATKRAFKNYPIYRPADNPLYTVFKYTEFEGFDYRNGDGTLSRRDPSKIIKVGKKYYMWYTKRDTKCPPIGAKNASKCDDTTPSTDWDLSEIWYATSKDGFTWKEEGVAIRRPEKPKSGWRSVSTPDILEWKGKFYLYYQSFSEPSGLKGDYCPVSMSYADTPDGPWTSSDKVIIENGSSGTWDQFAIHDPYPLVHDGKIYIYYKSAFNRPNKLWVAHGLAIADDPAGPFIKHAKNPLVNSGHEVVMFPFKEGLAAMLVKDGLEHNTIQYAADWINFEIASIVEFMPTAAGPYVKDAFTDSKDGEGISWGACHLINYGQNHKKMYTALLRFDCELRQGKFNEFFKNTNIFHKPEVYLKQGLSKGIKEKRQKEYRLEGE